MNSSLKKFRFKIKKKYLKQASRIFFWFSIGAAIALFLISSFSYLAIQHIYKGKIYPGVKINGIDFSNKTEDEARSYFLKKNQVASETLLIFKFENNSATVSAREIDFGYDEELLTDQALSIGRAQGPLANVSLIFQSYSQGLDLSPSYKYSREKLDEKLNLFIKNINKPPVEALFNFEGGKVKEFRESENGREVDTENLNQQILTKAKIIINSSGNESVIIPVLTKTLAPNLTTEKVNKMGIKELIGKGTSSFQHSIENRIYNVNLAASRINGILIEPGETFSFVEALGDVSAFTGYKQAYIIENGKTVLGDGGGVCQVSTTLFRAALNAGLSINERNAHAYRVSYYEQDSGPGIDATVFVPSVDLKFTNDTKNHILIQTIVDLNNLTLTFLLYGTKDGRVSEISDPVILSQTPAPEPRYEDDPNLPKGQLKQIDFAAAGAKVYFTRIVTKDGKTIIDEKFSSNYRPWQAVYLRGTKE